MEDGVNRRPTEAVGFGRLYPRKPCCATACEVTHNRRPAEASRVAGRSDRRTDPTCQTGRTGNEGNRETGGAQGERWTREDDTTDSHARACLIWYRCWTGSANPG